MFNHILTRIQSQSRCGCSTPHLVPIGVNSRTMQQISRPQRWRCTVQAVMVSSHHHGPRPPVIHSSIIILTNCHHHHQQLLQPVTSLRSSQHPTKMNIEYLILTFHLMRVAMLPGLVRAGVISGWAASIVALCQGRCWPATTLSQPVIFLITTHPI